MIRLCGLIISSEYYSRALVVQLLLYNLLTYYNFQFIQSNRQTMDAYLLNHHGLNNLQPAMNIVMVCWLVVLTSLWSANLSDSIKRKVLDIPFSWSDFDSNDLVFINAVHETRGVICSTLLLILLCPHSRQNYIASTWDSQNVLLSSWTIPSYDEYNDRTKITHAYCLNSVT